jgi:hypothetical protein
VAQHETALHETALHETAQHETAQHETAQHETALHETALHEAALWWARIRAAGPQLVDSGGPSPLGLMRLPEPGGSKVWLTPIFPNGGRPGVLDELDLPRPVLEQPNDTARVLAAALKCCWPDPAAPLWPGVAAPFGQVAATFEALTGRDEVVSHRALVAALRRLSWSSWLMWDEDARTVRLGPRVVTWSPADLSTLRELWRSMPAQPREAEPTQAQPGESQPTPVESPDAEPTEPEPTGGPPVDGEPMDTDGDVV